jgi:hypothetical protein
VEQEQEEQHAQAAASATTGEPEAEVEVEVEERPPPQMSAMFVEAAGPLKDWQVAHEKELEQKKAQAAQRREEQRRRAREEAAEFYNERQAKIKKVHANNVQLEKAFTGERDQQLVGNANGWPRVWYLIESSASAASASASASSPQTQATASGPAVAAAAAPSVATTGEGKKHPARDTSRLRELLTKLRAAS